MCKNRQTGCVILVETPRVAWQGVGHWPLPRTTKEETEIVYTVEMAVFAGLRKFVAPGELCNITLFLTEFPARPLLRDIISLPEVAAHIDLCEEQISWAEIPKHAIEGGG